MSVCKPNDGCTRVGEIRRALRSLGDLGGKGLPIPPSLGTSHCSFKKVMSQVVLLSSVPGVFRKGSLFTSLSTTNGNVEEDGEETNNMTVIVPDRCCKFDFTVVKISDAKWLMSTLTYWGVDELPHELLSFLFDSSNTFSTLEMSHDEQCQALIDEFAVPFPFMYNLEYLRLSDPCTQIQYAAEHGWLVLLQGLHKLMASVVNPLSEYSCTPEQYIQGHCTYVCSAAARGGFIACLTFAHAEGYAWDDTTCMEAAANGQLQCLQYLHEQGCPCAQSCCTAAATNGHLPCLEYLASLGCYAGKPAFFAALDNGHFDCFKFINLRRFYLSFDKESEIKNRTTGAIR
jgi:hypothetical protein